MLHVTAQHLAHPYPEAIGLRLMKAAAGYWLAPSIGLDRALWTEPSALWHGYVAARLADLAHLSAMPLPGFLCIHAQNAGPWGLSWQSAAPWRTACILDGDFAPGGPYRVLLRCERDWTGTVTVCSGFAQPVYSLALPLQVTSSLERDIVSLLLRVQDLADAAGQSVRIARRVYAGELGPLLIVTPGEGGYDRVIGAMTCRRAGGIDVPSPQLGHIAPARYTTGQCLEDGSFQRWLAGLDWHHRSA